MTQQALTNLKETFACIKTLKSLCSKEPAGLYWLHLQIVTSGLAYHSRIAFETAESLLSDYKKSHLNVVKLNKNTLHGRMKGDLK